MADYMTITDYARSRGVSGQAVRQQITRYADDLAAHIHKQGRTRYLDADAVAFLDGHRQSNAVTVVSEDNRAAVERLQAENADLLRQLAASQGQLAAVTAELAAERQARLADRERLAVLEDRAAQAQQPEPDHRPWWRRLFD